MTKIQMTETVNQGPGKGKSGSEEERKSRKNNL